MRKSLLSLALVAADIVTVALISACGGTKTAAEALRDLSTAASERVTVDVTYRFQSSGPASPSEVALRLIQRPPDWRMDMITTGSPLPEEDGQYSLMFLGGNQYTCDWPLSACIELDPSEFENPFGEFGFTGLAIRGLLEEMLPDAIVEDAPRRSVLGIEGQCFTIEASDEDGPISSEVCFSPDAVWLYLRSASDDVSWTMEATALQMEVDDADLDLPYAVLSPDDVPEIGERGFLGSTTTDIGEVPPIPLSEAIQLIDNRQAVELWVSTNDTDYYEYDDPSGETKAWRIVGNDVRIFSRQIDSGTGQPILAESGETIGVDDATLQDIIALAKARGIGVNDYSLPAD